MAGITYTKASAAPVAGLAIGDPIALSTATRVLHVGALNDLQEQAGFTFDGAIGKLTAARISSLAGLFEFPDGVLQSDGANALINNFSTNYFQMGPVGLGTYLWDSVFTLEGVQTIEQSFQTSAVEPRMGSAFLWGGTFSVAATWISVSHFVFLSLISASVNYGAPSVVITPGIGFDITSTNPLDDSVYNFIVFNSF